MEEKNKELKQLQNLLQQRVDQAPQFINLKRMLANKEKRIEELEAELE